MKIFQTLKVEKLLYNIICRNYRTKLSRKKLIKDVERTAHKEKQTCSAYSLESNGWTVIFSPCFLKGEFFYLYFLGKMCGYKVRKNYGFIFKEYGSV